MPGKILPTFTPAEVDSHNHAKSCYVTLGSKVYDVTSFLNDHPGGGDLILEYAGKDVKDILRDEASHNHSEAAYEILEDLLVGFLDTNYIGKTADTNGSATEGAEGDSRPVYASTGMSREEDLSVETDVTKDYQTFKFLDLNKPLLLQLWNSGFSKEFYLQQIHRPRHYKGGESAPLFGNFLEPLSKTAWYVVPLLWLPPVTYGSFVGFAGLGNVPAAACYWLFGLFLWTLIEYLMHRFLFHIDGYLPDNRVGITLHFLLHGIHHYLPMDKYRLVMPPTLFVVLATPFWKLAHTVFFYNWYAAVTVFCGGVFGYICYDMTHYFLHHRNLPAYYKSLKKYHLEHHFADYENGFGVTSRFWDRVFGTELQTPPPKGAKAQ
ncbi:ceramide very long chain fatty acid hydroxylase SCS7 [Aspergillus udagawae]|uniref:Ceramide very long chain fatty acid hydroxylase n=1 Tax=Aspergillus udagawae TaxID=91492 RepID=A0A8E0V459_9EURO|nr:fatty acid alpha-hydroxylase [Aspergillus udagawae]GFF23072.1 ceramide very long chain fatty acid hydroxylase SCS7 [Aspergillus udagawae]GIC91529.1 fatty acid alpha-hydroxylase [Aspergillus udagawae]